MRVFLEPRKIRGGGFQLVLPMFVKPCKVMRCIRRQQKLKAKRHKVFVQNRIVE